MVFLPTSSKSFPSAHPPPHPIGTTLTYVAAWEWHVTLSSPENKSARTNCQETPSASLLHAPHLATTRVHTTLTERLTERQRQSLQGQKNCLLPTLIRKLCCRLRSDHKNRKQQQQQQKKSRATTTTTTSARLLLHDLVSSATPAGENQRQNLFENTRDSQEKKRDPDLHRLQSRSLFSSLLSSVLLFLLLLQQRSAPPPGYAPPVLGTRERPCPFRPCRGPESGRHGGTGPSGGPHAGNPAGFLEFTHSLSYLHVRVFCFFLFFNNLYI